MLSFATSEDRLLAEPLMQPTLIRVIDNLRKHIETTDWQSTYVERLLWPASATEAEKQQVQAIASSLETASPEQAKQLRQQLSTLPSPVPAYQLQLTRNGNTQVLDVWQLCFQVCFVDYAADIPAQVDRTLLDIDNEVNWVTLDAKAKQRADAALQQLMEWKN
jgi:hypothetical protein